MRVYVAAKFEERERARWLMSRVEARGHGVTHDWTIEDPGTPEDKLAGCARKDVDGASTADVVLLLWHPGLQGGLAEMGVALGRGIPVWLVGAPSDAPCIFFRLCRRFETEGQALDALAAHAEMIDGRRRCIAEEMVEEVSWARHRWPPMGSAHEAFAVLREEVDELWRHVMTRQSMRDLGRMREEAIQIGAMAIRFIEDVIDGGRGRK